MRDALSRADSSLFVLASKSGSTIEPNVMAAEARRRVEAAGHRPWGSRFIAITDPNSPLHERARAEHFREIFLNPPDIGGRYSALSLFGMVPAALMGIPLDRMLQQARAMADDCRASDTRANPGLALGALMATAFEAGRDKLTRLFPNRLASFGLWVEQLIAESTGKHGKGFAPIAGESASHACAPDRVTVVITLNEDRADARVMARCRSGSSRRGRRCLDDSERRGHPRTRATRAGPFPGRRSAPVTTSACWSTSRRQTARCRTSSRPFSNASRKRAAPPTRVHRRQRHANHGSRHS